MKSLAVLLLLCLVSNLAVAGTEPDEIARSLQSSADPQLLSRPVLPEGAIEGSKTPERIPDPVAYEILFHIFGGENDADVIADDGTVISKEAARRSRIAEHARKAGLSALQTEALVAISETFLKRVAVLDEQARMLKDRYYPDPDDQVIAALDGLQQQREALIGRTINTISSRVEADTRQLIDRLVKETVKRKINIFPFPHMRAPKTASLHGHEVKRVAFARPAMQGQQGTASAYCDVYENGSYANGYSCVTQTYNGAHVSGMRSQMGAPDGRRSNGSGSTEVSMSMSIYNNGIPSWGTYFMSTTVDGVCPYNGTVHPMGGAGDAVPVANVTVSGPTSLNDGSTGTLSATLQGATATAYAWSFTAPSGSGNNPNPGFTSPASNSTGVTAKWFASPNNACTNDSSTYTIKCQVSYSGGPKDGTANLTATVPWTKGGETTIRIDITSIIADIDPATGQYHVTSANFQRVVTPTVLIPAASQFNNKAVTHENKHKDQFETGMFKDTYSTTVLRSRILALQDPTVSGLQMKMQATSEQYRQEQDAIIAANRTAAENEAYAASDPVAPQYLFQKACSRYH